MPPGYRLFFLGSEAAPPPLGVIKNRLKQSPAVPAEAVYPYAHTVIHQKDIDLLASLAQTLSPQEDSPLAIDIGCGWGIASSALANQGLTAIGLEPIQEIFEELAESWFLTKRALGLYQQGPHFFLVNSDIGSAVQPLTELAKTRPITLALNFNNLYRDAFCPEDVFGSIRPKAVVVADYAAMRPSGQPEPGDYPRLELSEYEMFLEYFYESWQPDARINAFDVWRIFLRRDCLHCLEDELLMPPGRLRLRKLLGRL